MKDFNKICLNPFMIVMKEKMKESMKEKMKKSMKENVLFILLFFLLLIPIYSAKDTKATMNVTMEWDIISDGELEETNVVVFIPQNSKNQRVTNINFSEDFSLVDKNDSLIGEFHFEKIKNKKIVGNFIIETDYLFDLENKKEHGRPLYYLPETKHIKITNEIKEKTLEIVSNTTDFPDNVIKIMEWVKSNIVYDKNNVEVIKDSKDSEWVFKNRIGVCDEFSSIFAAMTRSIEIPTRIVIGYSISNEDNEGIEGESRGIEDESIDENIESIESSGWIPHAWTEVYNEDYGWIEVDPTNNEFMNLNQLRIRIGAAIDQEFIVDKINASSKDAKTIDLKSDISIKVLNNKNEADLDINLNFPEQDQKSRTQLAIINMKNKNNVPLFFTASLILPNGVTCESCYKNYFLAPNEDSINNFTFELPTILPNVQYTFPVSMVTDYKTANFSFDRLFIIERTEYTSIEELPLKFKLFVGLFIILMIALVVGALVFEW